MKHYKLFTTLLLILCSNLILAQVTLENESKTYNIKTSEDCYIKSIPIKNDSNQVVYYVYIGSIQLKDTNTISMNLRALNTILIKPDNSEIMKNQIPDDGVTEIIDLNINQIESIENFRSWFMVPAAVGWLSLISGLAVSPLISIDYENGGFNNERFLKTTGVSLAIGAPCLTIAYTLGKKKSYVVPFGNKKIWKVL